MILGYTKINAKILRNTGFPFVSIKKCNKNELLNECL